MTPDGRLGGLALCAVLALAAHAISAMNRVDGDLAALRAVVAARSPERDGPADRNVAEAMLVPDAEGAEALAAGLRDLRVRRTLSAMSLLASEEWPGDLDALMRRWGTRPVPLAETIVLAADRWDLDPLIVTAMAWRESRFRPAATGDHMDGVPRSCGITQVRTDFPGRPTCERLMDARFALLWTVERLAAIRNDAGRLNLSRWNGGGYERDVWRDVDWIRTTLGD